MPYELTRARHADSFILVSQNGTHSKRQPNIWQKIFGSENENQETNKNVDDSNVYVRARATRLREKRERVREKANEWSQCVVRVFNMGICIEIYCRTAINEKTICGIVDFYSIESTPYRIEATQRVFVIETVSWWWRWFGY